MLTRIITGFISNTIESLGPVIIITAICLSWLATYTVITVKCTRGGTKKNYELGRSKLGASQEHARGSEWPQSRHWTPSWTKADSGGAAVAKHFGLVYRGNAVSFSVGLKMVAFYKMNGFLMPIQYSTMKSPIRQTADKCTQTSSPREVITVAESGTNTTPVIRNDVCTDAVHKANADHMSAFKDEFIANTPIKADSAFDNIGQEGMEESHMPAIKKSHLLTKFINQKSVSRFSGSLTHTDFKCSPNNYSSVKEAGPVFEKPPVLDFVDETPLVPVIPIRETISEFHPLKNCHGKRVLSFPSRIGVYTELSNLYIVQFYRVTGGPMEEFTSTRRLYLEERVFDVIADPHIDAKVMQSKCGNWTRPNIRRHMSDHEIESIDENVINSVKLDSCDSSMSVDGLALRNIEAPDDGGLVNFILFCPACTRQPVRLWVV